MDEKNPISGRDDGPTLFCQAAVLRDQTCVEIEQTRLMLLRFASKSMELRALNAEMK